MNSPLQASTQALPSLRAIVALCLTTFAFASAQAALLDRGGGMVYDDVANLSWLAHWNQAQASGADDDGRMTWMQANSWANNLSYGGFDDWRLPLTEPNDTQCSASSPVPALGTTVHYGYGCSGSEMGQMFYNVIGATAGNAITTGSNTDALALLEALQLEPYWSRTEVAHVPTSSWYFHLMDGGQFSINKDTVLFAVAVREGDVLVSSVPEPPALSLVLLAAAMGLAQRALRGQVQR